MGVTGSSSKRKSSKRKSSKLSHQARRKKKSRREKSKKLRRRDDSGSSNSDDDSFSSMSLSSYSSEDDYRSRKGRSRSRSDAKSRRKKARRRSPSVESSEDSPRAKKRKRSKKDVDSQSKKKSRKKKSRRDVSVSSASSSSSSSEESEFERRKGRLKKTKKVKRDPSKTRKSISRSSSCSSLSRYSNHSGSVSFETLYDEKIVGESKSRRLKSVITFVEQPHVENKNMDEKDSYKEEIDYDHDDYPSCRSNDSNGEGGGRDFGDAGVKTNNPENENKSEIFGSVSGDDSLELMLRQKALENLSKFRGERKVNSRTFTNQKNENDTDMQVSAAEAKNVQDISPEHGGLNELSPLKEMDTSSVPTFTRESIHSGEVENMKISDGPNIVKESKQYDISQTSVGNPEKEENTSSASRLESLGTGSSVKEEIEIKASPKSNILVTKCNVTETTPNSREGTGVTNVCDATSKESTSCVESMSRNQEDESEGGQFKEKTMSVMRGGEMVQVSYKVYIPKKAPALARRQLKR